jgi:hypothetical protein
MKTAAMILAIVAFGAAMISGLIHHGLKTQAHKANGERWPGMKSWMWNMPLRVRDFQGHAADLAAASTKVAIVGYACFLAAIVALAIAKDDPAFWYDAIGALAISPVVLGLFALCLHRSPNSKMGH